MLSGNAQLLKIHEQKDDLAAKLAAWKKNAEAIAKRWPAWERLLDFHNFAAGLPEAEACAKSIAAITERPHAAGGARSRTRADQTAHHGPAHRPRQIAGRPRRRLQGRRCKARRLASLERSDDEQRATIAAACQLTPPPKAAIGTDDEILAALRARTLADRRNLLDAVPQRFSRALEEASQAGHPEAERVALPGATINNTAELDQWLTGVRQQVEEKLKDGPVIL